jgi:prepilin-type N-terminal cleavage/methylation domain-containing protein
MNPMMIHQDPCCRRAAGFSLIELVMSSALLSVLVFAVSTLSVSGGQAQEYARRMTRCTEITQEVIDDMRLEVVSSVRLFGDEVEGNANLAMLDLDGAPLPLGNMRLPTIAANQTIGPDAVEAPITGNCLFFAKLVWTDEYECSSGKTYLLDVYRWIYYYLTPEDGGPNPEHPIGINIVRIESEPLIDGGGVDRIADSADRAEMLLHLAEGTPDATGVARDAAEVVWLRGELPSTVGTFRQVDSLNGSLSTTPLGPRPNPWSVLRSDAVVNGLLSYRHHSIASNYATTSFGVGTYGVTSLDGDGFPHGFEVQIIGPSSARQVHLHMVVSSTRRTGQFAWSDMQLTVDARDL